MKKLREQLSTMDSFKEKVDYIWEYYKLHIIGSIVALVLVISLISTTLNSEERFNISVVGENLIEQEQFTTDMNSEFPEFNVNVDYMNLSEPGINGLGFAESQKFMAHFAAGEIDVIVLEKESFNDLINEEAFAPLTEYVAPSSLDGEKHAVYTDEADVVYGLSTSNIPIFNKYEHLKDKILAIPRKANNKETIKGFVDAISE
ncbi:hypothetical protein [Aquibacillus rhizosphaerae]|uniref:Extracellular solute-binding protein n=1 Tax=Aquibacillus rhizosphaerae TaxID=3051431 RepID=A0ABT7L6S0_9BACI|nr:hypothetical protein [Aquibacillus sp. LR5S19]MDL4840306.1 hypothetical protein [Aquibacillus sp. LR5S19]